MHAAIKVLDHGYIRLVEAYGHGDAGEGDITVWTDDGVPYSPRKKPDDMECGIIEAARQSTQGNFRGWTHYILCDKCGGWQDPASDRSNTLDEYCEHEFKEFPKGDAGLLSYLYSGKPQHATPFEFAGGIVEVQAPIFVFREWHRHRTQCLGPDTMIHFEMPKAVKKGKHTVYKQRIEDLWQKWQPTVYKTRPDRQVNALWPRSRIQGMLLRTLDEDEGEFTTSSITDIIRGEPKEMLRITTSSGRMITATPEHRFITSEGWRTLQEAVDDNLSLAMEGVTRGMLKSWEPLPHTCIETWKPIMEWEGIYDISTHGRVRRIAPGRGTQAGTIKEPTVGAQGYPVIGLTYLGRSKVYCIHDLMLIAFVGTPRPGVEARHVNHNRLDYRIENLCWGSSEDNHADMLEADRHQRLVPVYEEMSVVEQVGELPTYDLTVSEPWHNFVADGFVVHNSYNEMSARYAPLPDLNYIPTKERCFINSKVNQQAGTIKGAEELTDTTHAQWESDLRRLYQEVETHYQYGLQIGLPKEIARIDLPVGRYSRMRANANLRNWLAFMTLRSDPNAQWEIRQYSDALGTIIQEQFPRTYALFDAKRKA